MLETKKIIVDLDGTLANIEHRLHLIRGPKKDWNAFFLACSEDSPVSSVIDLVSALIKGAGTGCETFIFSGRSEAVQEETLEWLSKHIHWPYSLTMRPKRDFRPDEVLKAEFADRHNLNAKNVLCVIDDRRRVVEMWRAKGFLCLQVADHNF